MKPEYSWFNETFQDYIDRIGAAEVWRLLNDNGLKVTRVTVHYWATGQTIPSPYNAHKILKITPMETLEQIYPARLCARLAREQKRKKQYRRAG